MIALSTKLDAYTTVEESWLFTTSRSTVTPLLRFVVDLLYKLFLQLTRFSLTHRVCGCRASCLRHYAAANTAITYDLGGGVSQTILYETRTVKAKYINLSSHNRPLQCIKDRQRSTQNVYTKKVRELHGSSP